MQRERMPGRRQKRNNGLLIDIIHSKTKPVRMDLRTGLVFQVIRKEK